VRLLLFDPCSEQRYSRQDNRKRLPRWIQHYMSDNVCNLSTDQAMVIARRFLRGIAQPLEEREQYGRSMLSLEDVRMRYEGGHTASVAAPAPAATASRETTL
jgi:hypothetical protein